ncbi:MAG TPA: ATP-binding protein, partial [Myxococcota bacterium]|nr:ATP-binding protein [Myxococcota bacterium]
SHPRVVDLNGVVREAEGMLRALVPENIAIDVSLDAALRPVRLDPRQVHQILLNLAANARDAMPDGGRLEIRSAQAAEGAATLSVADTGEGMDEGTCERIFEPFFTTKRPGEGTGLGLASVYGIVEQCGGTIEVDSEPGRGSCFRIAFPTTEAPLEGAERGIATDAPARGSSVLVVEDQDSVRRLLGRQLRRAGFDVTLAEDGEAALAQLADGRLGVDLLVTDVTMPRLGGSGLAESLRVRWPDLRVLYISGYSPDDLFARIEADPRADFLAKPFSQAELLDRIEALLAVGPR